MRRRRPPHGHDDGHRGERDAGGDQQSPSRRSGSTHARSPSFVDIVDGGTSSSPQARVPAGAVNQVCPPPRTTFGKVSFGRLVAFAGMETTDRRNRLRFMEQCEAAASARIVAACDRVWTLAFDCRLGRAGSGFGRRAPRPCRRGKVRRHVRWQIQAPWHRRGTCYSRHSDRWHGRPAERILGATTTHSVPERGRLDRKAGAATLTRQARITELQAPQHTRTREDRHTVRSR